MRKLSLALLCGIATVLIAGCSGEKAVAANESLENAGNVAAEKAAPTKAGPAGMSAKDLSVPEGQVAQPGSK